jgi:serine/threonine-protein kinase RsbT
MITESYRIVGGNFERAGLASLRLKDRLKRIGVDSKLIRRIMIAAYEAEMNVVIHANS